MNKTIWLGNEKFLKLEFLAIFQLFHNQIFKSTSTHYFFKLTRLVFFNPNIVFNKICEK